MYDFLLFVHILTAFCVLAMVVVYSGFVLGGPATRPAMIVAQVLDNVGGAGTLIFGVWLALYVDGYGIFDGWILVAIALWMAAAETGRRTHAALVAEPGEGSVAAVGGGTATAAAIDPIAIRWHLIRTAVIVLLLADMIWKPGA